MAPLVAPEVQKLFLPGSICRRLLQLTQHLVNAFLFANLLIGLFFTFFSVDLGISSFFLPLVVAQKNAFPFHIFDNIQQISLKAHPVQTGSATVIAKREVDKKTKWKGRQNIEKLFRGL